MILYYVIYYYVIVCYSAPGGVWRLHPPPRIESLPCIAWPLEDVLLPFTTALPSRWVLAVFLLLPLSPVCPAISCLSLPTTCFQAHCTISMCLLLASYYHNMFHMQSLPFSTSFPSWAISNYILYEMTPMTSHAIPVFAKQMPATHASPSSCLPLSV